MVVLNMTFAAGTPTFTLVTVVALSYIIRLVKCIYVHNIVVRESEIKK